MIANTFRELAIEKAKKQSKLVDSLLEESPFLAALPMEASTHGLSHVYEELVSADAAKAVDLDEALPEVDASSKLVQTDLRVLGARIHVGEDKAKKFGSAAEYFNKKAPSILKKTGADMETALLYNSLRNYAIKNHSATDPRVIYSGDSTDTNTHYSIIAVHFSSGEITGLYDEEGFGKGKAFDIKAINGGNVYLDSNNILVYGVRLKTYFGLQLANPRYVSAYVNIMKTGSGVTVDETKLDQLVAACRGRPENTVLVMHPMMRALMQDLKGSNLHHVNSDNGVNRTFQTWNGIEILDTYNMLNGTEALVSGS